MRGRYFEIPVQDLDRAVAFYEAIFAISMEREVIDGNQYAHFPPWDSGPGISDSLAQGESYVPSRAGTRIYLSVFSIDETLALVTTHGGNILYTKTDNGQYGSVAEFADSEGNCIALHEGT